MRDERMEERPRGDLVLVPITSVEPSTTQLPLRLGEDEVAPRRRRRSRGRR